MKVPTDKEILACRKIIKAEQEGRKKICLRKGCPVGYVYGLIEWTADQLTRKEKMKKQT